MMYREEEDDTAFNELMQELQQQFLLCKERTSQKFQKLEELIEVAAHKLSSLMSIQDKQQEEGFSNSLNRKANTRQGRTLQQPGVIPDSVHHLELRLPKFEGAEVCQYLRDPEHQLADFGIGYGAQEWPNPAEEKNEHAAYTGEPIYDEESEEEDNGDDYQVSPQQKRVSRNPTYVVVERHKGNFNPTGRLEDSDILESLQDFEHQLVVEPLNDVEPMYDEEPWGDQECWPEQEFILAALHGGKPNSPNFLKSEICRSGGSEKLTEFSNIQDSQPGSVSSQLDDRVNTCFCPYWPEFEDQQACLPIFTEKAPTKSLVNKPNKVLEDGDNPKLVDCKGEEKQGTEYAIILPNIRKDIEDVPCRDSPGQKSSNLVRKKMIIFDPGGYESTNAVKMVKEMFRHHTKLDEVRLQPGPYFISSCQGGQSSKAFYKESKDLSSNKVKIVKDAVIISFGGHHEHVEDHGVDFLTIDKETPQSRTKLILVQFVTSSQIQGQKIQEVKEVKEKTGQVVSEISDQYLDFVRAEMIVMPYMYTVLKPGSFEKVRRLEDLDASRSRIRTIFDPGGGIISVSDAQFIDGTAGTLYVQHLLQEILNGKELSFKGHGLEMHDPP